MMERQLRQLLERTAPVEGSAAPRVERVGPPADAAARQPAANAPATPSPAERRLKLVIESAPVGLVITDSAGEVLAANKAALMLFGVQRLDDVLKKRVDGLVAPEDRERLVTFIGDVCRGTGGTIEYEVVGQDGTRRGMETRAVPLMREASAPTAFLSATWDVTDRKPATAMLQVQARHDLVEAERDALKEALREAETAYAKLSHDRAAEQHTLQEALQDARNRAEAAHAERQALDQEFQNARNQAEGTLAEQRALNEALQDARGRAQAAIAERQAFDAALQDARSRTQTAVAEAEERHQRLADQWSNERAALFAKLRASEEQQSALSARAQAEQRAGQTALEAAKREYQESMAARTAHSRELEQALSEARAHFEEKLAAARAESDSLAATVKELECRYATFNEDRRAEREQLEDALQTEMARSALLLDERGRWQIELAEILRPVKDASSRVERLLGNNNGQRSDSVAEVGSQALPSGVAPVGAPIAPAEPEEGEDRSWQF